MRATFISISLFLLSIQVYSQIEFDNGYFINNNNQRVECLIKNSEWKNNPAEFEYRLTANSEVEKGTLESIKEFGINGFSRYVRADVKVDLSPSEIAKLSKDRNPEWSNQRLFLKVLVEGKATLYYYTGNDLACYFYSADDTTIKQLIYKEYYVDEDHVAINPKFREQLWSYLRCENAKMSSVENMIFKKAQLVKYIEKYNDCNGQPSIVYGKRNKKETFHLGVTPGINFSSVSVSDSFYKKYNTNFKNQLSFRIGAEAEYVLPFNRNKWRILFEPTFQYQHSEKQISEVTVTINYKTIEFPIGFRHYFFLNKELKLFVNAFFVPGYSLDFNSTITYDYPFASPLQIKTDNSIAFGGGISYNKLSAEIRYYSQKAMLNNFYWVAKGSQFTAILGFKIL